MINKVTVLPSQECALDAYCDCSLIFKGLFNLTFPDFFSGTADEVGR